MMNYKRNHKFIGLSFALALISSLNCQAQLLPTPTQEAKPGVRWWWMGFAVDVKLKLILSSLCMLMGLTSISAQNALQNEILEVAHRTNNYFMTKYSDPTIDTFVKKIRTSNLWIRAVYYGGLMALYEIDPQQRYLDYTDKWADYHKWTARGSVNDTDADN